MGCHRQAFLFHRFSGGEEEFDVNAFVAGVQPNMVLDVICKKGKFIHMEQNIHKLYMGKFGGGAAAPAVAPKPAVTAPAKPAVAAPVIPEPWWRVLFTNVASWLKGVVRGWLFRE